MRHRLMILTLLLTNSLAFAQPNSFWMTDKEIALAFSGKSIEGHYADGRMFEETYTRDNRLKYVEGSHELIGKWSVIANTFCTIYKLKPSGGCFRVHQSSLNCYEFYFQASDEQTAKDLERRGRPLWTARAWYINAVSTCKEQPSV